MADIDDGVLDQEVIWEIVSLYFEENGLVSHQIKSYDQCVDGLLAEILRDKGVLSLRREEIYDVRESDADKKDIGGYDIDFSRIKKSKPSLKKTGEDKGDEIFLPHHARTRQLTYSISLTSLAEVKCFLVNGEEHDSTKVSFGLAQIPCMVRSKYCNIRDQAANEYNFECSSDPGGYFIVNGNEKVIIGQEHMVINKAICFHQNSKPKYDLISEIRSQPKNFGRLAQTFNLYLLKPTTKTRRVIMTNFAKMESEVPLFLIFRALDTVTDKEIVERICYDPDDSEFFDVLRPTIEDGKYFSEKNVALEYLSLRVQRRDIEPRAERLRRCKDVINDRLLPHIGDSNEDTYLKSYFVGYMTHNLIQTFLGRRLQDDRDHYSNKRLDLAGPLIGNLFAMLVEKMKEDLRKNLQKKIKRKSTIDTVASCVQRVVEDSKTITSGLHYSISTGNWSANRESGEKSGVCHPLSRLTYMATLSNLRRTNTPIGKDGKLIGPRVLHNTHWGYLCPVETPEGSSCGLVKNLSLLTEITPFQPKQKSENLIETLKGTIGMNELRDMEDISRITKIFVDGSWVGFIDDSNVEQFVKDAVDIRREGIDDFIDYTTSIVHNMADKEIYFWADGGRVIRPLLVVSNERILLTNQKYREMEDEMGEQGLSWEMFVKRGFIEYLDVDEEETMLIAMTPKVLKENSDKSNMTGIKTFTHCELHPSLILGVCGSIIPFSDHNPGARNSFQCAMGKQAIGIYSSNFMIRTDSSSHILWYPQKPLVTTRNMKYLKFNTLPAGINAIVAILCYTGYNQEDSLMINSSSIDRGLFRSYFFRTYQESAKREARGSDVFAKPSRQDCVGTRDGKKDKIDDDGLAIPGRTVYEYEYIIGRMTPMNTETGVTQFRDISTSVKPMEKGVVDLVVRTVNKDMEHHVKVRTRQARRPEIGDKFCSRHGQKGVCGMTYRQEDMPFTRDGVVPDIIMNPHAIPSRMTIGHIIETLLGKLTAYCPENGSESDSTPFTGLSVDDISAKLHEYGFERFGNETLYNGRTGKRLKAKVFMGPTYYQRLKHMVGDKMHARSTGKITNLIRQPVEGRSMGGGLRFGEMERDCLIAHGVSSMITDRFLENSDRYLVCVCKNCGLIAVEKIKSDHRECRLCGEKGDLGIVEIPYAFKLVLQELISLCIHPRLDFLQEK